MHLFARTVHQEHEQYQALQNARLACQDFTSPALAVLNVNSAHLADGRIRRELLSALRVLRGNLQLQTRLALGGGELRRSRRVKRALQAGMHLKVQNLAFHALQADILLFRALCLNLLA